MEQPTLTAREVPFRPSAEHEQWREEHPLKRVTLPTGLSSWLVLRQAEAQDIIGRTDSLSADTRAEGYPHLRQGKPTGDGTTQLVRMDPPVHTRYRRMFAPFFSAKRVQAWEPALEKIVDDAIDDLLAAGPPADFHERFALVVPSKAICMLLGVDYDLHHEFERLTKINTSSTVTAEERMAAVAELRQLMSDIIDDQRVSNAEGVIAKMVDLMDAGEITRDAAVANALLMVVAGHETTAHTISQGTIQMIQRPDLQRTITEHPEKLPALIEEMLRTQSITDNVIARAATAPIAVQDTTIEPGEGIIFLSSSINHDPRAFPNPLDIDLDRGRADHIGFGGGIHSCVGQSLARAELRAVFGTLFRRIPTLRLAADDDVEYQRDAFIFGMRRLPVQW
jgi:pentalenic acid synthase